MVTAAASLTLWTSLFVQPAPTAGRAGSAVAPASAPVVESPLRPVWRGEEFPWYDSKAERVRPVLPWFDVQFNWLDRFWSWLSSKFSFLGRWMRWLNFWRIPYIGGLGDVLVIGIVMLALTLLLVGLLELLRRYRPLGDESAAGRAARLGAAGAARVEDLPAGVAFDSADPLAEARRLRDRGEYARAVVYLFAHQLLTLDGLGKLRLAPGRTGRQLVRSVGDRDLRRCVEPTLRLFEAFYYGHRAPRADDFEAAWTLAEEFEQLVATEAAT
jgi:hypothetical protein